MQHTGLMGIGLPTADNGTQHTRPGFNLYVSYVVLPFAATLVVLMSKNTSGVASSTDAVIHNEMRK